MYCIILVVRFVFIALARGGNFVESMSNYVVVVGKVIVFDRQVVEMSVTSYNSPSQDYNNHKQNPNWCEEKSWKPDAMGKKSCK